MVARIVGAEQRGRPAELALEVGASAVALAALQFLAGTDSPCIAVAVRILACDAQRHVCGERRVDDGLGTIGAKAAVGRLERALEAVARAVGVEGDDTRRRVAAIERPLRTARSEEHTSELQSLMRISYAVFCLKKKNKNKNLQK